MIRPCFNKLSSAMRTVFDGIAKPRPCEPPVVEAITVLMPITSPRRLISGPPPFRTDDSVCHSLLKSKRIADGQDKIPGLHRIGVSKFEWLDARIIDLKHSNVR